MSTTALVGNATLPAFDTVVVTAALKDLEVELEELKLLNELVDADNVPDVVLDKGIDEVEEIELIKEVLLITEETWPDVVVLENKGAIEDDADV